MANKSVAKNMEYSCESCGFISSNKTDYNRHVATAKHKMANSTANKKRLDEFRCGCGKIYKFQSSLCKHKKTCASLDHQFVEKTMEKEDQDLEKDASTNDLICKLLKDLAQSQQQVVELLKEKNQLVPITNTTIHNTNCNNTQISINMFLNEYCKDAITIGEFIKSIQPTVEDVLYMTKYGNREGLSKILTNALGQLEITERPLHCTDLKRHTTYVKEPEGWTKETDQKHLKRLCNTVQHGCMKTAIAILESDPNYRKNGTEEYEEGLKIMTETTAANEATYEQISRALEENTHLHKDTLLVTIAGNP
jgi:hypothetical protein